MTDPAPHRLALGFLAACAAAAVVVPARPVAALPGPEANASAVELLDRAREAAETQPFDGVVAVEWRDGRERHSEQVPVHSAGGVLRFGDEVVGAGARRMVHSTDGWLSLWGHDVATLGPSPTAKYRLAVAPGPDVAARATDMVAVQLVGADRLRERLYVDRQSGLLLRRELLDSRGDAYRSVAFLAISNGTGVVAAAAGGAPRVTRSEEPAPARHLKAPYKIKSRIGTGYRLVGAYRANGVVQQFFSDGLHGLSVFATRCGPTRRRWGRRSSGRATGWSTPPSPTRPGPTWPERYGTCRTPTRRGGSGAWPRRWSRSSGGGEGAPAAENPPAFALRAAPPDAVIDPVDEGVLEALQPYAALHARPFGYLDAHPVGREELRRGAIPAGGIAHPVMIHASISNVGRGLVVPASDGVHRNNARRPGRGPGSGEAIYGRRAHAR